MGNKCSISKKEQKAWAEKYGVPKDKLTATLRNFKAQADKKGLITKDDFVSIMCEIAGTDEEFASRVFDSFDVDNSGKMDIHEYLALTGVSYGGTIEEKLRFSFRLFDADDNGRLDKEEVASMLTLVTLSVLRKRATYDAEAAILMETYSDDHLPEAMRAQIHGMVENLFKLVDTDKNGTIDPDEFTRGFREHPEVCKFFNQF